MEKRIDCDENNFNNINIIMERMENGLDGSSRKLINKLNSLNGMVSLKLSQQNLINADKIQI